MRSYVKIAKMPPRDSFVGISYGAPDGTVLAEFIAKRSTGVGLYNVPRWTLVLDREGNPYIRPHLSLGKKYRRELTGWEKPVMQVQKYRASHGPFLPANPDQGCEKKN